MRRLLSFAAFVLMLCVVAFAQHGGGHSSGGGHAGFSGHGGGFSGHSGGASFGGMHGGGGFHGSGPSSGGFRSSGFRSPGIARNGFGRTPYLHDRGIAQRQFLRNRFDHSRFRGDRFRGDRFRDRGHNRERRFRDFAFRNCFGWNCGSWPWWYAGYDPWGDWWWWDPHSSYDEDRAREIQAASEMNQESLEEQRALREADQDLYARSDPPAEQRHQGERAEVPSPPTVLVFRDQRRQEVQNYAIVGQTLWSFAPARTQKIPLADLDIAATTKANEERGMDFHVPATGEGQ
jgi:hypothetical protein